MGGKSLKLLEGFTEGSLKSASGQCQTRRGGGGGGRETRKLSIVMRWDHLNEITFKAGVHVNLNEL